MRIAMISCSALAVAAFAAPVAAQTTEPSVENYLCTFAGKCGQAAEPVVTRDAPATKGFRIARAPSAAAPAAATGTPTRDSGSTRGFRVARAPVAAPSAPTAIRAQPRAYAATPRSAVAAGVARPHADLRIAFQLGSDQMTPTGIAKARIFAKSLMLPELSQKRFVIEGHTDSLGSAAANRDLSRRRAAAVADFLAGQGVGRDRLEVKGMGSDDPISGRRASDPANRRVEAALIS